MEEVICSRINAQNADNLTVIFVLQNKEQNVYCKGRYYKAVSDEKGGFEFIKGQKIES